MESKLHSSSKTFSFLDFLLCGYCCSTSSSKSEDTNSAPLSNKPIPGGYCGGGFYQDMEMNIHLGKVVNVRNSSVPMLEVNIEFDSDSQQIQNHDILYIMSLEQTYLPKSIGDLDPRCKVAIEQSDFAQNIGRGIVNLSNIAEGTYIMKYIRFSEPLGLNSRVYILGSSSSFDFQKTLPLDSNACSYRFNSQNKIQQIQNGKGTKQETNTYNKGGNEQSQKGRSQSNSLYSQNENNSTNVISNVSKSYDGKRRSMQELSNSAAIKKLLNEQLEEYEEMFEQGGSPSILCQTPDQLQNNGIVQQTPHYRQHSGMSPRNLLNRLQTVEEVNSSVSGDENFKFNRKNSYMNMSINSKVYLSHHMLSEKQSSTKVNNDYYQEAASRYNLESRVSCNSEQQLQQIHDYIPPINGKRVSNSLGDYLKPNKRKRSITAKANSNKKQFEEIFDQAKDLIEVDDEQLEDPDICAGGAFDLRYSNNLQDKKGLSKKHNYY